MNPSVFDFDYSALFAWTSDAVLVTNVCGALLLVLLVTWMVSHITSAVDHFDERRSHHPTTPR